MVEAAARGTGAVTAPGKDVVMNRNVILMGAGASYGSEAVGVRVPPLGAGLFDELCAFSGNLWGALPPPYPDRFRVDFEEAFGQLAADSPSPLSAGFSPTASYPAHLTGPLLRKMAEFFLQFEPTPDSLYSKLAQRIRDSVWPGAVASLNYDLLLQIALERAGLVASPWDKGRHSGVYLPHGCCALLLEPGRIEGQATLVGIGNRIRTPVIFVRDTSVARARLQSEFVPPAMAYYEPSKTAVTAPDFLDTQKSYLSEAVTGADVVLIVGAQVRERDTHIWNPLGGTRATLVYCSPEVNGFREWSRRCRPGRSDVVLDSTFQKKFDEICAHLGIA